MAPQDDSSESRADWAEDRTDWAEDRTLMAIERTFAGWLRTGLTIVVVALGLHAVIGPFEPPWVPKAVATLFLAAALSVFAAAWSETRASRRKLASHAASPQSRVRIAVLAGLLCLGTLGIGAVLWLL